MRPLAVLALLAAVLLPSTAPRVAAQPADLSFLTTRAEATRYEETTRYDEVMAFLDVLAATSDRLTVTRFGYSVEGRVLPLAVWSDRTDGAARSPEALREDDRLRVLVFANIHAGEVAGKEAALILLRNLVSGRYAWADSLTLLVAPIYNADGNERVSLFNRPRQNGPVGGMGQRPNVQGYDLNRDHMKLDAPETRALVGLFDAYDPHVVLDLHTTNGTAHAYHLTYAPPLHPDTPAPVVRLLRDRLLPEVSDAVRAATGWRTYYYGNLPWPGQEGPRGWYTFDHRPRFSTNYLGLRGRLGILSEAYAYASFEERILVTLRFVESVLGWSADHADAVRSAVEAADAERLAGAPGTLRADFERAPEPVDIFMGEVETTTNPYSGATIVRRLPGERVERMDVYGTFAATETVLRPGAYVVPADLAVVVDRLRAHGVRHRRLAADSVATAEHFRIDSVATAPRAFQGHHERTYYGAYETSERTLPAGALVVPVDQPLGRLVFALLEPRSDDGLASWGLLDEAMEAADGASVYPILRLPAR